MNLFFDVKKMCNQNLQNPFKLIFIGFWIFALAASCAHRDDSQSSLLMLPFSETVKLREPAAKPEQKIEVCGEISLTETPYNAIDAEDLMYTLKLDCNRDQTVNHRDQDKYIGFKMNEVKPVQKGWITRWTRKSRMNQKSLSAKPYVCVKAKMEAFPCQTGVNVFAFEPEFRFVKTSKL